MQLRDHPALRFAGYPTWPPIWAHTNTKPYKRLSGEIGVFINSLFYDQIPTRLFLRMEFQQERYMGYLVTSDPAFCKLLHEFLKNHAGKSMKEIGDLDLSHTL